MSIPLPEPTNCPNCHVPPGKMHHGFCDIARCALTGRQRGDCPHPSSTPCNTRWDGHWPGTVECFELGWIVTDVTDIDGNPMPDLNRLYAEFTWDPGSQRMVPASESGGEQA
ncbi:hypothetical protein ACFQ6U_18805 [Streptomyces sp. NPDC056465]|uniref:hypothetical protein n=1 Tax=Streptomyces sp. NPDC056465 TaxID=3345829 RepID=UPI003696A2E4